MNETKPSNPKDLIGSRKIPMSVVPANVLAQVALGMLEGACVYGRHNYRIIGVRSSVYYDAAMRHLMAWWEGEDIDPKSKLPHVVKAITSLVVLMDAIHQNKLNDDRPPPSKLFIEAANEESARIIDESIDAGHNPIHYTNWHSKMMVTDPSEKKRSFLCQGPPPLPANYGRGGSEVVEDKYKSPGSSAKPDDFNPFD